ncbi:hypothetical protein RG903_02785 [Thermithiobacillus tepidarius DSM 3134]|uniref:hypothetical protein n=1 Tax=Thermithiobacillus tepidarius TaxID=929 RepID=UPI000406AAD2|nr:hypothetical protein [Thermithiobacillus tepidarius]
MSTEDRLPRTRFLDTLGLVRHEGKHLAYSLGRVFSQPVNGAWVKALEQYPEQIDTIRATFVAARFSGTPRGDYRCAR